MEELRTDSRITEEQPPKRILFKNDVVLFIATVLLAIVLGTLLSYFCMKTGLPYIWFSIGLYALFALLAVWLNRSGLVTFRYTLSERMLTVERVIGKKARPEVQVHLADIREVRDYAETDGRVKKYGHGRRSDLTYVRDTVMGESDVFLIAVSRAFAEELRARVRQSKR